MSYNKRRILRWYFDSISGSLSNHNKLLQTCYHTIYKERGRDDVLEIYNFTTDIQWKL